MAVFRATIEKEFQNNFWTNVYHLQAGDLLSAVAQAQTELLPAERAITSTGVIFTKLRVDDNTVDTDSYYTIPINLPGLWLNAGQLMPLFVVVRVDFGVAGRRPSRKYLRATLDESVANSPFDVQGARINDIQNAYATPLANLESYVDESGNSITSGVVYPRLSMRQLRRGSKKKSTP